MRSVVVVSNEAANGTAQRLGRGAVSVVPLSPDVDHVMSFHVLLDAGTVGLPYATKAQAEQVRTVEVSRLLRRLGALTPAARLQLDAALRLHLGL